VALIPLHSNQHAYWAEKSMETAHLLMVCVEKVLDKQETTLHVFLDIEGACNYTSFDTIYAVPV
jgi:hypothetical protein